MKNLSQKIFDSDFNEILMAKGFYTKNLSKIGAEKFFQEIQKIAIFSKAIDEKLF